MNQCRTLLACVAMMLAGAAHGATETGPIVVELFTSQGCNSCPPADALLGELARRPDVLALGLHVTYWNYLGWKDRFSQDAFDQRQQRYARQLGLGSAYTPQMVINGAQDVVGNRRGAVNRVMETASRPAKVVIAARDHALQLRLPALPQSCDCLVTLFGVEPHVLTAVGRGENAGRSLDEYQVVRFMQAVGAWTGMQQTLEVKPLMPLEGLGAFAILAQDRRSGRVLAAGKL